MSGRSAYIRIAKDPGKVEEKAKKKAEKENRKKAKKAAKQGGVAEDVITEETTSEGISAEHGSAISSALNHTPGRPHRSLPDLSETSTIRSIHSDDPAYQRVQRPNVAHLLDLPFRTSSGLPTINSMVSNDPAYERVRRPNIAPIEKSGIQMAPWEKTMHEKSGKIRNALKFGFGKKTGPDLTRVTISELAGSESIPGKLNAKNIKRLNTSYVEMPATPLIYSRISPDKSETNLFSTRSGKINFNGEPLSNPPNIPLPPLPQGPQLKRFLGCSSGSKLWYKWNMDPDLWMPNGNTLIFLDPELFEGHEVQPSFRVDARIIEAIGSKFLIAKLREGRLDDSFPSFESSIRSHSAFSIGYNNQSLQRNEMHFYDEKISIRLDFPTPENFPRAEVLRYHVTTRNLFAILFNQPLVGVNIVQALHDLLERLKLWIPEVDAVSVINGYIQAQGLDDVRSDPAGATSLLVWCEHPEVRWVEGWKEAWIHCVGMLDMILKVPEYHQVTPITQALLDRANVNIALRAHRCEERLKDFDFSDMWSKYSQASPAKDAFLRLQVFFKDYYQSTNGAWPPNGGLWLTRFYAQKLQKDFGALYEYLVNRSATWERAEGNKDETWIIVNTDECSFQSDPDGIPFTDIIVAFDSHHNYPPIPHPYPLIPAASSVRTSPLKGGLKNKTGDIFADRTADVVYVESTNMYLLGSDFEPNNLVTRFKEWERHEKSTELTPSAARLGRWVLIYGILQTLASISVDVPGMLYTRDVHYHLCPELKHCPPWQPNLLNEEATHDTSYCWKAPKRWQAQHRSMASPEFAYSMQGRSKESSLVSPTARGFHHTVRDSGTTTCTTTSGGSYDFGERTVVYPVDGGPQGLGLRERWGFNTQDRSLGIIPKREGPEQDGLNEDSLQGGPGNQQDLRGQMENLQLGNRTTERRNQYAAPPLYFARRQINSPTVPQTPQTPSFDRERMFASPAFFGSPIKKARPDIRDFDFNNKI